MPEFCLTIDLDRDVNLPVPGCIAAGSLDRGYGNGPRYASTKLGVERYADLLDEMSLSATFFAEAETLRMISDSAGCLDGHEIGLHGLNMRTSHFWTRTRPNTA